MIFIFKRITKRSFIRCVSLLLAVIVALGVVSISAVRSAVYYEKKLGEIRLSALIRLSEYTAGLEGRLLSAACASDAALLGEYSASLEAYTAAAKTNLAFFPQAQTGDICAFFAGTTRAVERQYKKAVVGQKITVGERQSLVRMSEYAGRLARAFAGAAEYALNGACELTEVSLVYEKNGTLPLYSEFLENGARAVEYEPSEEKEAAARGRLLSMPAVTREEAAKTAARFIGIEPALMRELEDSGDRVEKYNFYYDEAYVGVSKNGGYICDYVAPCDLSQTLLEPEDAADRALEVLEEIGYEGLECVEASVSGSACDMVFAPVKGGVIYLTDSITACVCLNSGKLYALDASQYIANFRKRDLPQERLSIEQARELMPEGFAFVGGDYVLIASASGEQLCCRLECEGQDFAATVYINAVTKREEKITVKAA